MDKTITVSIKQVYGTERIYPVCEFTTLMCQIAKRSTLSRYDISLLKFAGYTVNVEAPTL